MITILARFPTVRSGMSGEGRRFSLKDTDWNRRVNYWLNHPRVAWVCFHGGTAMTFGRSSEWATVARINLLSQNQKVGRSMAGDGVSVSLGGGSGFVE